MAPTNDELATEATLQEKGLNAPRLNPHMIDSLIVSEYYHVPPGSTLTICVITLVNGFTVTGESAAASPENFNRQVGKEIANKNARAKIWPLAGYALKEAIHKDIASVVRACFVCRYKDEPDTDGCVTVFFDAVIRDGENADWSKYTPAGLLQMTINPETTNALDQFEAGREYFLDLVPRPKKENLS